jgi:hypothetical protein
LFGNSERIAKDRKDAAIDDNVILERSITPINSSMELREDSVEIDISMPVYTSIIKSIYFSHRITLNLEPLYYKY